MRSRRLTKSDKIRIFKLLRIWNQKINCKENGKRRKPELKRSQKTGILTNRLTLHLKIKMDTQRHWQKLLKRASLIKSWAN